ncbi:MAG: UDP-N-acetylmuramate dehydrogenase [Burkholderiaceae bacterium]
MPILERMPLKALNTFGIAACAQRFVPLDSMAGLDEALDALREAPPAFVLGGGSNVLFTGDPAGTVLRVGLRGLRVLESTGDEVLVEAAAGEAWDPFVQWTLAQGLSGLENLALIPGSVGASPIQNIGAYGVEIAERFDSLQAVSLADGSRHRFDTADCGFAYRDSVFKRAGQGIWLVLSVRYRLSRRWQPRLDYGDIRTELREAGVDAPGPADVARAVSAIRRRRLPDPARLGNAGSFFKNPLVPSPLAAQLREREPSLPVYPSAESAPDGTSLTKLSAAWLIEQCGWKGHRDGDAGVAPGHALVLVNHGEASGAQMLALARRIQASVQQRFGVMLEAEPVIVGPARL